MGFWATKTSPGKFEALVLALRIRMPESVRAPAEVVEVVADVRTRIESKSVTSLTCGIRSRRKGSCDKRDFFLVLPIPKDDGSRRLPSMHSRIGGRSSIANSFGGKFHPGISVEAKPGIEPAAQLLRIGLRQSDERHGHVPGDILENDADLLGPVRPRVFRIKPVHGVVGQGADGSIGISLSNNEQASVDGPAIRVGRSSSGQCSV